MLPALNGAFYSLKYQKCFIVSDFTISPYENTNLENVTKLSFYVTNEVDFDIWVAELRGLLTKNCKAMKTLKIIILLITILVFNFSHVNAQDKKMQGENSWLFNSDAYTSGLKECLGENVTGTVNYKYFFIAESKYWNYHETGHGDLLGESGVVYTLDYNYNNRFIWHDKTGSIGGYSFPMLIKREGKLVAIVHESYHGVVHWDNLEPIVDRYIIRVQCK